MSLKDIPKFRFEELDLVQLKERLTWYDLSYMEYQAHYPGDRPSLPIGTLLWEHHSEIGDIIYMVGDATCSGYDLGCGCCSDKIEFTNIAFLSELISDCLM